MAYREVTMVEVKEVLRQWARRGEREHGDGGGSAHVV